MAPRKLSDSDKTEIIDLYRQPGQTTSTLAEQYGVSNSTVSRILKTSIPSEEYSALISQKRMANSSQSSDKLETSRRKGKKTTSKKSADPVVSETLTVPEFEPAANQPKADGTLVSEADEAAPAKDSPKLKSDKKETEETTPTRRRRRRRRTQEEDSEQLPLLETEAEVDETPEVETSQPEEQFEKAARPKPILANRQEVEDEEEDDDEDDLLGLDETLGDDFGDDDLDEEDDEEDDLDDDGEIEMPKPRQSSEVLLSIMPLDEAVLPKPCYLVVDMRAELITRPLVEFSDLGKIPSAEEKENTLPVFDNHRVARRFSRNKQRVIKVPDGSLITRTSPYLTAKGITRLLVDGQVFDLVGMR